ncbi:hypothetical protein DSECCO2_662610 [anaerobic digester metagenome]
MNDFGIEGSDRLDVVDRLSIKGFKRGAANGISHDIGLNDCEVGIAGLEQADILNRSAGGVRGDV